MNKIFTLFCVAAILLMLSSCSSNERKDVVLEAKTPYYTSLDELEKDADIIVIGVKKKELYPLKNSEGAPFATLSSFLIQDLIKDKTGRLLNNDVINVLENEYVSENIHYHIAGYTMMNTKDQFILFLRANQNQELVYYTPLGVNYGISSLGNDYEMTACEDVATDEINALRKMIRAKYLVNNN